VQASNRQAAGPKGGFVSFQVLMSADPVGGVLSHALELARALARREVRVVLAVMGGSPSPAQREEAGRIPGLSLHESAYRLEWMDDPWDDVARAGEWLLNLEERTRPDVVHLSGLAHGALPFRAPSVVVANGCALSWFEAVFGAEPPPRFDRYRREAGLGLAGAHAVVTPTRAALEALTRLYGAPARARVITAGRDPERYHPTIKEERVLALGRLWDPGRNIAALEAAAPQLPWPVCVAGSAVAPDGTRRALPGLTHLGVLSSDEAAAALARAAVYALPARYQHSGVSVLEAALSGCALVLGDIPSLRELWGGAALFVEPDDTEDLVRALQCLIHHPGVRAALGARARSRALDYSLERMALAYLAVYDEVSARPRAEPLRKLSTIPPPRMDAAGTRR
jgi:glycosyltransferase involved in cell wall biosynthesis